MARRRWSPSPILFGRYRLRLHELGAAWFCAECSIRCPRVSSATACGPVSTTIGSTSFARSPALWGTHLMTLPSGRVQGDRQRGPPRGGPPPRGTRRPGRRLSPRHPRAATQAPNVLFWGAHRSRLPRPALSPRCLSPPLRRGHRVGPRGPRTPRHGRLAGQAGLSAHRRHPGSRP